MKELEIDREKEKWDKRKKEIMEAKNKRNSPEKKKKKIAKKKVRKKIQIIFDRI